MSENSDQTKTTQRPRTPEEWEAYWDSTARGGERAPWANQPKTTLDRHEAMRRRASPAPYSVTRARWDGKALAVIAREHGWSISKLKRVLRDHSLYCFGRVEDFMMRPLK